MAHTVYLQQVEVIVDPKINENFFIGMEVSKQGLHMHDSVGGVRWELCQEEEVQECMYCCNEVQ